MLALQKVQQRLKEDLRREVLHDSIQQRAKLAQESVDEMMKNPFTVEQEKAQVEMLNDQFGNHKQDDSPQQIYNSEQ